MLAFLRQIRVDAESIINRFGSRLRGRFGFRFRLHYDALVDNLEIRQALSFQNYAYEVIFTARVKGYTFADQSSNDKLVTSVCLSRINQKTHFFSRAANQRQRIFIISHQPSDESGSILGQEACPYRDIACRAVAEIDILLGFS